MDCNTSSSWRLKAVVQRLGDVGLKEFVDGLDRRRQILHEYACRGCDEESTALGFVALIPDLLFTLIA